MKPSKTILLAALLTLGLGCGYSAKSTTPAVAGTMPTVSALAPSSVTAGSPSFVLTVNGTNFNGNAAINLNGTAQMTSRVSANQLTATVPAASVATAGTVTVTVTNPGTAGGIYGGGTAAETSNSMTFTIN
jgi:type IV pilus biogenesis protein CpaD/CtpE